MGGTWSGRWHNHRKARTVEECLTIDIAKLSREMKFEPMTHGTIQWTFENGKMSSVGFVVKWDHGRLALVLSYCLTGGNEICEPIYLESMPMRFGGVRWWGQCPLASCAKDCLRRVRKLYLPPERQYFGCRSCHRLTYRSVQEHDARVDRLLKNDAAYAAAIAAGFGQGEVGMGKFTALGLLLKAGKKVEMRLKRKGR